MSECTELLNAARHYVQNYLLDEYKDASLCCGEEQHQALVAVFDAIKDAEKLAPVASCEWCAAEKHRGRHLAGCPNEPSPAQPTILAKGDPGWVDKPTQPMAHQILSRLEAELGSNHAEVLHFHKVLTAPRAEEGERDCQQCYADGLKEGMASAGDREVGATYGWPGQDKRDAEGYPGIAHDLETMRAALQVFTEMRTDSRYFAPTFTMAVIHAQKVLDDSAREKGGSK